LLTQSSEKVTGWRGSDQAGIAVGERSRLDECSDRIWGSDHFGIRTDLEHERNDADERQKSAT
jgi:hypothetical protein